MSTRRTERGIKGNVTLGREPPTTARGSSGQRWGIAGTIAILLLGGTLVVASRQRAPTARCPNGLIATGPRCCAAGQREQAGVCIGVAQSCPPGLDRLTEGHCALPHQRVKVGAGSVRVGPGDWESQGVVIPRTIEVQSFWMDRGEVTLQQWRACVAAGKCRALEGPEPGVPVTGIDLEDARAYCGSVGGHLPSVDQWVYAAATSAAFRYPWGHTGLVCRRAAFGLSRGPCAEGATGPEIAGSRPDGTSATGLVDMAGNVAELAITGEDEVVAMGGSFRSAVAAQLKSWAAADFVAPAPDVGLRCAYDDEPGQDR